ncbi:bacteriorhodopsin [Parabacteroides sp. PF5-5]|uniref:DUF3379 family protein n=1 Tax=unclassified Parabacteroides TaxID=2649774 RepID=UPI002474D924|nr:MULTISPECIES: DUF3379 family protein [unclassified Parabacteroides]MDH6305972.1 bacteriorhodopsin [Parabacteroides sp. PH5-39]MDH6317228.1 bacteriorhodopsin [Parabacteroides sp. PF5-13]MDH6320684.1 bacteriorhodopsin [Parabacteroides sp. PH5-13]MDH6324395.1 bacteriorhodopsin [Parabacteroides sp. PH5-8]MDH6328413.1 bacteriorhodopsin [Parabacteroides sp. PH5-41]
MDDKEFDSMIDEALNIPVPEGLAERLEQHIDKLAENEKKQKRHRLTYWATSAAAVILLTIGIFIGTDLQANQARMADTYTDPAEAAIAAEKVLAFMSTQLNKGLDQVENAGQEMEKVNQILDKHFKE